MEDKNVDQQGAQQPPAQPLSERPEFQSNVPAKGGAVRPSQPTGRDEGQNLGIIGLAVAVVVPFIGPIAGVVLGIMSRNKSRETGHSGTLGLVATVVSAIFVVLGILFFTFVISAASDSEDFFNDLSSQIEESLDEAAKESGGSITTGTPAGDRPFDSLGELDFVCEGEGFPSNAVASTAGSKRIHSMMQRPLSDGFSARSVVIEQEANRADYDAPTNVDFLSCLERGDVVSESVSCELSDSDDVVKDYPLVSSSFTLKIYDLHNQNVAYEKQLQGDNKCPRFFATIYDGKVYDEPDSDILEFELNQFIQAQ